jgi:hypothetical protein
MRSSLFLTLKGGFNQYALQQRSATIGTFFSSVDGLRRNDVSGVLYPGGGFQAQYRSGWAAPGHWRRDVFQPWERTITSAWRSGQHFQF